MKNKIIDVEQNEAISRARDRADNIMEWAKMFWQAQWVFLLALLILVLFPMLWRASWVAFAMFVTCWLTQSILSTVATRHLLKAIKRNMPRE